MNGWQKLLFNLRKTNPIIRKNFNNRAKRNDFKNVASNAENYYLPIGAEPGVANYLQNEYSTFEEIPNDFFDFVQGINQIGSIPKQSKRYFKQSPIPYWHQDYYYHDFF